MLIRQSMLRSHLPVLLLHELKYPRNFKHFDYVNPETPKGVLLLIMVMLMRVTSAAT